MSASEALQTVDRGYWGFVDALVVTIPVRLIQDRECCGTRIVEELKRAPVINFGEVSIDFCSDVWDFDGITSLNIPKWYLKFRYQGSPLTDEIKLFMLTSIVWQKEKVQSLTAKCRRIEKAVLQLDLRPANVDLVSKSQVEAFIRAVAGSTSLVNASCYARDLCEFLAFQEKLFDRRIDPEVLEHLRRAAREWSRCSAGTNKYPEVPTEYLAALMRSCKRAMADESESPQCRITAGVCTLLVHTGFRAGECLGLEVGAVEVIPGVDDMPDIANLTFKTYKGSKGDGSFKVRRTIVDAEALEAYLFLESYCEKFRRNGASQLVVYPGQEGYCAPMSLNRNIRRYLALHAEEIPCLNTEDRFPELKTCNALEAAYGSRCAKGANILPDDILVYPTSHMFRVTFATRLYESGCDFGILSRFMNHMSSDMTAGYVRSDKKIEASLNDVVYRAVLEDGASLLGPSAEQFEAEVRRYAASLKGTVHKDWDGIIAACSEKYPLRRKVGGVCIRCGNVRECPGNDRSDQIYCAFGVCANQCHMYFMVDVHLEDAKMHIALVEENIHRGHVKAAANELRKAQNIIGGMVVPELDSLSQQISAHGVDHVLRRHPHLESIVANLEEVERTVRVWSEKTIALQG